ncbi:hypothetical protein JHK82_047783 [Glycine max]|uniref:Protein FLX-like 1 n=2 Tax=Glycine soja TaxID=3848 RepID=A0A0B2Q234_GLYSO|nr:hypothetical protein JHK85_048285 [Glycine max]KAG5097929.1 hypothetical protein JHK82_047783 [Glycine max]KHN15641.1 hypothetical protein glysoja_031430 [Glycine soja]RZB57263.1 Protein FLX-like 1 [Glycine soja]
MLACCCRLEAAIDYEKKGFVENYEHGHVMEKKLVAMAWEMKKLRAEIANAEERAWAVATAGNPGQGYNANYGNVDAGYAGNPYPYNMHLVQPGLENFPQGGPGPPAWGTYDMQRAQGHRISVKQSYNWYLGLQLVQGFKSYLLMNVMGICLLDGP